MTDHRNGLIRALHPEVLSQCTNINMKYLCPDIKLFLRRDTCLMGLISNNPETIFGHCDLEFHTQKGTMLRRFGINQYGFCSNRTQTIEFNCDEVRNTYVEAVFPLLVQELFAQSESPRNFWSKVLFAQIPLAQGKFGPKWFSPKSHLVQYQVLSNPQWSNVVQNKDLIFSSL